MQVAPRTTTLATLPVRPVMQRIIASMLEVKPVMHSMPVIPSTPVRGMQVRDRFGSIRLQSIPLDPIRFRWVDM